MYRAREQAKEEETCRGARANERHARHIELATGPGTTYMYEYLHNNSRHAEELHTSSFHSAQYSISSHSTNWLYVYTRALSFSPVCTGLIQNSHSMILRCSRTIKYIKHTQIYVRAFFTACVSLRKLLKNDVVIWRNSRKRVMRSHNERRRLRSLALKISNLLLIRRKKWRAIRISVNFVSPPFYTLTK